MRVARTQAKRDSQSRRVSCTVPGVWHRHCGTPTFLNSRQPQKTGTELSLPPNTCMQRLHIAMRISSVHVHGQQRSRFLLPALPAPSNSAWHSYWLEADTGTAFCLGKERDKGVVTSAIHFRRCVCACVRDHFNFNLLHWLRLPLLCLCGRDDLLANGDCSDSEVASQSTVVTVALA